MYFLRSVGDWWGPRFQEERGWVGGMGGRYTESYTVGDGWGEWGVGIPKVTLWGTGGGEWGVGIPKVTLWGDGGRCRV